MMVETDRKVLIERLDAEQCSCVIYNGGETRLFWERGVQDLYRLLKTELDFLRGAFIADKVIGKAAAALMALGREVSWMRCLPGLSVARPESFWNDPELRWIFCRKYLILLIVLKQVGVRWRLAVSGCTRQKSVCNR